ncbi:PEP-CTERM sorting domain-containing protein [Roseateles sp.]|uniref:PEP-CTERM sorting domain-containing protein n=1 Tax=Roseateles sp. TaxID=1971397 RepID=UPI003946C68E
MRRVLALLTLCVASVAALAAPVPTNLLVNGSFEATPVGAGSWTQVNSLPGWTWMAGPGTGFEVRNNVAGAAQDGSNYLELDTDGNTSIGQTLNGLVAGLAYDLSFWYAPREFQPAATNGIQVYWNGLQLGGTLTADGGAGNLWSEHRFSVVAQSGANVLSFSAVGRSDTLGGNLDNVRLSQRVPEPGSLALTLTALASLVLLHRALRRRPRRALVRR